MKPITRFYFTFLSGISLAILALLLARGQTVVAASDAPQVTIRYVATTGSDATDCTNSANPCATIQYAVDQAGAGDEVRVAGGAYTSVQTRPRNDTNMTGFVDQIVYLTKTLTIRGGYTLTNWIISNPELNLTTLDAQFQGRGIYVTGAISITLDGLQIMRGSANGQKGNGNYDAGGGIYAYQATLNLLNSQIVSCTIATTIGSGSAVYLYEGVANVIGNVFRENTNEWYRTLEFKFSEVTFTYNEILSNTAKYGAGVNLEVSPSQILSNTFMGNNSLNNMYSNLQLSDASGKIQNNSFVNNNASGIEISGPVGNTNFVTIHHNDFLNNVTNNYGGAISVLYTDVSITHNMILSNTAHGGGGIHLLDTDTYMENNWLAYNHGGWAGGAMYINSDTALNSRNDVFVDNTVDVNGYGSGFFINTMEELAVNMFHPTIANNYGGNETGILFLSGSLTMTNAILSGHDTGISVFPDWGSVHFEATLWNNTTNISGTGPITTGTINLYGNPGFIDPAHGNYHLSPDSIAIDTGIDAGVITDIDGDTRPRGNGFDIGADESSYLTRYVATTGSDTTDCTNSANPCATIQYAVDQAEAGDEVRVAGGEYTDLHTRPRNDTQTTGFVDQIVYLTKTVTIRGGYTTTNWLLSDPVANPTTLDAQYQGRGVYITGAIAPTLQGLRIVHGNADGQGGRNNFDAGGGIYSYLANMTLLDSQLISNTVTTPVSTGGAVYLYQGDASFIGNLFKFNTANSGGAINSLYSDVTFIENQVISNTSEATSGVVISLGTTQILSNTFTGNQTTNQQDATLSLFETSGNIQNNLFTNNDAAGLYIAGTVNGTNTVIIQHNEFSHNVTQNYGGAISASYLETLTMTHNTIFSNTATGGGGIHLLDVQVYMEANQIVNNHGGWVGGGMYINTDTAIFSQNDIIVNNSLDPDGSGYGSGIFINSSESLPIQMFHPTIANNFGGETGIFYVSGVFTMTNGILSGHDTGIHLDAQGTVHFEATLWDNLTNITGLGTITTGTINLYGDPAFIDPAHGDYHLSPTSLAIDAGIDAGVPTDLDGDTRPQGAGFDIGADEFIPVFAPSGLVQLQGRDDASGAVVTAWSGGTIVATDTTDSSGAYLLTLPDGTYTVTIEIPLYLDARKTNVTIVNSSPFSLVPVTLKGGDVNDSDTINILDLAIIGAHYDLACGDPDWDPRADINGDCEVNLLDLVLAAGNFGKSSPVGW